jgi:putative transposase
MTAMESVAASSMSAAASMPRFGDGSVNLQELARQLVEQVVNKVMSTEADMACEDVGTARNGYRDRKLNTCIGTLNLRIPKVRNGCFFPEDVIERYSRTDRALVAAVAEMYRSGVSTRKVEGVAKTLGVDRLSKDQVSRICAALDTEAADLNGRTFGEDEEFPYLWLDATYVKCRDEGHVSSTAVVTAIACDGQGYRHMCV